MSGNLGKKENVMSQIVLSVVAKRTWAPAKGLGVLSSVCGLWLPFSFTVFCFGDSAAVFVPSPIFTALLCHLGLLFIVPAS